MSSSKIKVYFRHLLLHTAIAASVAFILLLMGGPLQAHLTSANDQVIVDLVSITPSDESQKDVWINIFISNNTGAAITLRGINASNAKPVKILQRKSLLGSVSWQPIRFVRVEAGTALELGLPDYRVIIQANGDQKTLIKLEVDFGPLGLIPVATAPVENADTNIPDTSGKVSDSKQ